MLAWALGFLFYSVSYNPLLSLFLLMLTLSKISPVEPCVFLVVLVSLRVLSTFATARCSRLFSYFPCPAWDSAKFPRSPSFFFVCFVFLVRAKCACCYRDVTSMPFPFYKKYFVTFSLPS